MIMPNNTEVFWEADGVSLHTYAWSIETIGGMGPPPLRGTDHLVPMRSGQQWVPKKFDANTITLAMWLRGVDADAGSGVTRATRQKYDDRWNDLIRLLWTPGRQLSLRKRFYDRGVLRSATAKAEYVGGLEPTMMGQSAGRCTVDLKIAEGVFFDDITENVPLVNGDNTLQVRGNAPTTNIKVSVTGARENVKVRNATHGVEFTYPRSILTGQNAVIDIDDYSVIDSSLNYDASAHIIHTGADQWLTLLHGTNVINLSSTSGAGTVNLEYRAAWI